MTDPAATIVDIARVLKPWGTLVIACRTTEDDTPTWMDPDRIRSTGEITAMLTAAGFIDIERERGEDSRHVTHLFVARLAGRRAVARNDRADTRATSV